MTTLQITMACIWGFGILGVVYWFGEQFNSGWQAILGLFTVVGYYGGIGAILYFTLRALMGY